ncbi:MAG: hypothetical protein LBC37_08470 [Zoogloeaceae bacterium]|jgi:hypothetical protein|nr:hypothetical protein [Zoogloeaceae bacterium]
MKNEFIQPRFVGARFDEHTLPVDVARDLAAYEALLIELAKHLYLKEHPERQRVPKGFSDAHLDIVSVEEGSARPVLALVVSGALELLGNVNPYYEQARDLIAECVAAPETALPQNFPKELLAHFNQFGRSLREEESLELRTGKQAQPAVLNPEKRKKLVLAANRAYEREIELTGAIAEVDWEKSTFRLRLVEGGQATIPMPESFHEKARQSGGKSRHYVFLKGVALYDSWERLQKVLFVESLDIIKNYPLVARLDELAQLEDGWYEGEGKAPDQKQLDHFAQRFADSYPEQLPLPTIAPKQDGGILLEWNVEGMPSLDVDWVTKRASFHAFGPHDEDIEADFDLGVDDHWEQLWPFLSRHVQARTA